MYRYLVWVRVNNGQTIHTYIYAGTDWEAKAIAEAQFGRGNVLNYTRADS